MGGWSVNEMDVINIVSVKADWSDVFEIKETMANRTEMKEMQIKVSQVNNSINQCLEIFREYIKGDLFGKKENGRMNESKHSKTTRKYEILRNLISMQKLH
jgi:hypothetical protein